MNADELKAIRDQVIEKMLAHPELGRFMQSMGHVISYLISEQDKRRALSLAMEDLKNELQEEREMSQQVRFDIASMKERSERNGKLLMTVIGSLLSVIALEILRLALGRLK